MSVTLKPSQVKYKRSDGSYGTMNVIADETTEQKIAAINSAGNTQIALIQNKGSETLATIPEDFTTYVEELSNKANKTRIDFDGTNFKIGTTVLNYKQLHDIHLVKPDFAFVVYGDRAYLLSYVQDDTSAMREMRFQSVIAVTDSNNLSNVKVSGIYVKSSDGVNFAGTPTIADINSENKSYKATVINDANKNSDVWYPTTKAVNDLVSPIMENISELKRNVWNAVSDGGCDNTGTNNCTDKIQNAINNASDGTVLYFPKGTYLIMSPISITGKKNFTICGDGKYYNGGTIIRCNYGYTCFNIYGGNGITIKDMLFDGCNIGTNRAFLLNDNSPTTMACRLTNTHFEKVAIQGFKNGIGINCPSGYNYFSNVSISEMSNGGTGIDIGEGYSNTDSITFGVNIIPNYIYFDHCNIDGLPKKGTANQPQNGINIHVGQMIFINECDICNFDNGYGICLRNDNGTSKILQDVYINNTSLYCNKMNFYAQNRNGKNLANINFSNNMVVIRKDSTNDVAVNFLTNAEPVQNVSLVGNLIHKLGMATGYNYNLTGCDESTLSFVGIR